VREPTIKFAMFGRDRYVTVTFELNDKTAEHVSAWFIDPKLEFGHSGGVTERVDDAVAECRLEFC
jgi:hypothetical protein